MNERKDDDVHAMTAPHWKWEINPNSVAAILGIILTIAGWGYVYSQLVSGNSMAANEITKIWARIAVLEANNSRLENLEYRMTSAEGMARDGAATDRETATALNSLASDQKVMKEILQRIEAQGGRRTRF